MKAEIFWKEMVSRIDDKKIIKLYGRVIVTMRVEDEPPPDDVLVLLDMEVSLKDVVFTEFERRNPTPESEKETYDALLDKVASHAKGYFCRASGERFCIE